MPDSEMALWQSLFTAMHDVEAVRTDCAKLATNLLWRATGRVLASDEANMLARDNLLNRTVPS